MASRVQVEIEGRELSLSNLDKVLYPATGFTKADVIHYFSRIAPVMLAHLAGRPPTLVRAPDGPDGERFFEKRCPPHHPKWVPTEAVVAGGGQQGCVIEELAALVWLGNLAALELHTHQWTVADPWHPTAVVLDLDPGEPAGILDCARVALELRDILEHFDLRAVVKTSGGKGLHLSVPLNTDLATHEETKRFALALGQLLESRDPKRVTVDMAKDKRPRRVFVDWSQNDSHKTTVCAYSLRIRERPTVSTPVAWSELEHAIDTGDEQALSFEAADVLDRIDSFGDLYAETLTVRRQLPEL
jgi:bifunctional non-homologous end joining protein LigD